ncbi:DUF4391 domain-containing protein [Comamonas sp. NLF-1-9]|nr:DUF4391 domain-containing protein [Comamonas sp. NLF-1-9]
MSQGATIQKSAPIAYPWQAAFGRALPKKKIREHSGANSRLKEWFVEQVEQIVWQYMLAPKTIKLPARPGVPEVQVFGLRLRPTGLHENVLRHIDGAVQFPVLFERNHGQGDQAKTQAAAYKRPSQTNANRWVLFSYFATDWMLAATARTTKPWAFHIAQLYYASLQGLIPLPARPQEALSGWIARVELTASTRSEDKKQDEAGQGKQVDRQAESSATQRRPKTECEQLSR